MKEFKDTLDLVIKFGVIPVLMINVWWLNSELSEVKEKMYDCFDEKETILRNRTTDNRSTSNVKYLSVAIIPEKVSKKIEGRKNGRTN
jgi:hypothetical protein